ncbi:MAG: hypothetical protein AB7K71_05925 [Polyangiaceae bacterium]
MSHHDDQHHHHHGQHHHHEDHHHRGDREPRERGPEGTEFLDLEPTRLLLGAASGVAKEVMIDLLRAAVRRRLEERLGAEIERIGSAAADILVDDFEANRRIEAVLEERRSSRKGLEERLAASLREAPPPAEAGPAAPTSSKPARRSKRGR